MSSETPVDTFEQSYWRCASALGGLVTELTQGALTDTEFRLIADNIPTLCWLANGDGYIVWYNRRWHDYCGTTPEQMEGWGWQSVHAPEVLPLVIERWTEALRVGEPIELSFPLRGADGVFRPFLTRAQPVRDASGTVVRWVGVNTELSATLRAESALRQERDRSAGVLQHMTEGFALLDRDFRIVTMNAEGLRLDGRSADEVIGKSHWEAYPDAEDLGELYRQASATGQTVSRNHRYIFPDGRTTWLEMRAYPLPTGELAVFYRDVTERFTAEEALLAERARLATLNKTGAALAAELDLAKIVQLVTDAGVDLTGAQFGAFFYKTVGDNEEQLMLFTLSGADREAFEKFGHPRATPVFAPTFHGEGVIRSDDITADPRYGRNAPFSGMPAGHLPVKSYLAVPVISRTNEVLGGLFFGHPEAGVFDEASERFMLGLAGQAAVAIDNAQLFMAVQRSNTELETKVAERTRDVETAHEALRQSQKLEAIGQLTGGIAHDFNNLLTVIQGSADLLRRDIVPPEKRARYIDAIAETADRAAKLTGQLLAFARRQTLRPEVFDAAVVINGISDMLRTILGSRIQMTIDVDCENCLILADQTQFETAIVNMVVNARDAMDGEGALTIQVKPTTEAQDGSAVSVSVIDTGRGIEPAQLERIFEPFFTTKEVGKGTGLGLSQVYGFAKQSGGEVSVVSEVGSGSTFTLSLPRSDGSVEIENVSADRTAIVAGAHILVVEDNPGVAEFAEYLLQDLGHSTEKATNARDAIAILERDPAGFDLVFSDVVMPGMNGIELAQHLQNHWPSVKVILTSGYSQILSDGVPGGFQVLQKPYSVETITKAIGEVLGRS